MKNKAKNLGGLMKKLSTKNKENLIKYLKEMRWDNYSNTQVLEELLNDGFEIKGYHEMTDEELITELEGYGFGEFCEECRAEIAIEEILLK